MTTELKGGMAAIADSLAKALVLEEFGIYTRLELISPSEEVEPCSRSVVILRCCFPREKLAGIYLEEFQAELVRCSGVLQEKSGGVIQIELSRTIASVEAAHGERPALADEVDQRLQRVLGRLSMGHEKSQKLAVNAEK